ncbi:MAG: ABC transporter substrate-binding protein [Candidatus Dormibacteria bacterium]
MKSQNSFPPGAGWLPLVVALIVVFLASTIALAPQFDTKVVGANNRTALNTSGTHQQTQTVIVGGKKVTRTVTVPNILGGGSSDTVTDVVTGGGGSAGQAAVNGDAGASGLAGSTTTSGGGPSGGGAATGAGGSAPTACDPATDPTCPSGGGSAPSGGGSAPSGGGAAPSGGGAAPAPCDPSTDPSCPSGGATPPPSGGGAGPITCDASGNGGSTAPGVSANEIHVASTIVSKGSSVGGGFLGEAQDGIKAAINEVNNAGGICGRRVTFESVNSGWNGPTGQADIQNYINAGNVFALVAEPDSEGLGAAIDSKTIDNAGMPVVGSDGMLKNQYHDPWVWPVAASTVSNMHIIAKYAYDHGARSFGIVFDNQYKFGVEGANAFDAEVARLTGNHIAGNNSNGACSQRFCGIPGGNTAGYSGYVNTFDTACSPCDAVVLLLEPSPAEAWMKGEDGQPKWYNSLYGGEPLFDDNVANNCPGCGAAPMKVWTGYHPAIQPFDGEAPVAKYTNSLSAVSPSDDPHNEFTEGAYLGTRMFIAACQALGKAGLPLTRQNLQSELNSDTFDLGLSSAPLSYNGGADPHIANSAMAMFAENYSGTFNGWSYQSTDFVPDPAPGKEL